MMFIRQLFLGTSILLAAEGASASDVGQDDIDACIDRLRAEGTPDSQSGTVLFTEFSEANNMVMLRDAGNSEWRCLVKDGIVAEKASSRVMDDRGRDPAAGMAAIRRAGAVGVCAAAFKSPLAAKRRPHAG